MSTPAYMIRSWKSPRKKYPTPLQAVASRCKAQTHLHNITLCKDLSHIFRAFLSPDGTDESGERGEDLPLLERGGIAFMNTLPT